MHQRSRRNKKREGKKKAQDGSRVDLRRGEINPLEPSRRRLRLVKGGVGFRDLQRTGWRAKQVPLPLNKSRYFLVARGFKFRQGSLTLSMGWCGPVSSLHLHQYHAEGWLSFLLKSV